MTKADDEQAFAEIAMMEAITALQLVKPEALGDLLEMLPAMEADPRAVATMRKGGTQLTATEKAALGLHTRAFISREMLAQLTPKGLLQALVAHETTLHRALFSVSRWKSLSQVKAMGLPTRGERMCPDMTNCAQSGVLVALDELDPLPPHDCRDFDNLICRSTFGYHVDLEKI